MSICPAHELRGAYPGLVALTLVGVLGSVVAPGCEGKAARPGVPVSVGVTATPLELELVTVLPLEIDGDFQPSGLLWHDGRLLTVSDKHDSAVYEIELGSSNATLRPFLTFAPPTDEPAPLDYEGLTVDTDGSLLVISESRFRVLLLAFEGAPGQAAPYTARASWRTASLEDSGRSVGCFQRPNANFEGITRLPAGGLLLAAERQPRGLLELDLAAVGRIKAWSMPESAYAVPAGRAPDFADLAMTDGQVYTLVRSAHLLMRLSRTAQGWQEGVAWSYAAAENASHLAYADRTYGMAEGLAIGEDKIFIILDNNGIARAASADDHRPLLYLFERPRDL